MLRPAQVRDTGIVNEFCTCGAKLPEDALFCHKCGKPQREIVATQTEEQESLDALIAEAAAIKPEPAPAAPEGINFRNRAAVRTALGSALLSSLLLQVPLPVFVKLFWILLCLLVAGFAAVYLYHRRTGQFLSVRNGARMGWLTGVFCFVIVLVLTVPLVIAVQQQGGFGAAFRKQIQENAGPGFNIEEAMKMMDSPAAVATTLIFVLGFYFMIFTGLTMIGGALGAKVLEKDQAG
ncbi:MAG: hypothetical protein JJE04_02390 [Acidobacteriia bacterium]|nr:hypothetical protein [Terriglobia bacterium]